MIRDRQKQLIMKLLDKTADQSIRWESNIDSDSFQVSFSRSSVKITLVQARRGGAPDYSVDLINSDGVIADSFTDVNLDEEESDGYWFNKMQKLHEIARRSALGSDEVLAEIINELDDKLPF